MTSPTADTPAYIEPMLLAALPYTTTGHRDAAATVAWETVRALETAGHTIIPTELTEARLQSILDAMRRAVTEANHIDWRTVAMAAHDEIVKEPGA